MFCKKCGEQIPDDSVFCPKCGQALNETRNQEEPATGGVQGGVQVIVFIVSIIMIIVGLFTFLDTCS